MRNRKPSESSIWANEKNVDVLRSMWADGYSASQIAERLGCSRSAIIGKVHRLKIEGRVTRIRKSSDPQVQRLDKLRALRRKRTIVNGVVTVKKPKPFVFGAGTKPVILDGTLPAANDADVARVKLIDLESHHCRWPSSDDPRDPNFGFCGKTVASGLSYCPHHAARAFQAPIVRHRVEPVTVDAVVVEREKQEA